MADQTSDSRYSVLRPSLLSSSKRHISVMHKTLQTPHGIAQYAIAHIIIIIMACLELYGALNRGQTWYGAMDKAFASLFS